MADFVLTRMVYSNRSTSRPTTPTRQNSNRTRQSIPANPSSHDDHAELTRARSVSLSEDLNNPTSTDSVSSSARASRSTAVRSGARQTQDHAGFGRNLSLNSSRSRRRNTPSQTQSQPTSQPNSRPTSQPTSRSSSRAYIAAPNIPGIPTILTSHFDPGTTTTSSHPESIVGGEVFRSLVHDDGDWSSDDENVETVQLSASTDTFDSAVLASEQSASFSTMGKLNKNIATSELHTTVSGRLGSGDTLDAKIDMEVLSVFEYLRIFAIVTCSMSTKKEDYDIVLNRQTVRDDPGKFIIGRYSIPVTVDIPQGPPSMAWTSSDLTCKVVWRVKIIVEKFLGTAVDVMDTADILLCEAVFEHSIDAVQAIVPKAEATIFGKKDLSMTASCDSMMPFGDDKEPLKVNVNLYNPAGRKIESVRVKCRQELRAFVKPDDRALKADVVPARALLQSVAPLRRLSARARETESIGSKSAVDQVANRILYPQEMRKKYNRPEGLRFYSDFQRSHKDLNSKEQSIDLVMVLHPSNTDFKLDSKTQAPCNLAYHPYKTHEGEGESAVTSTNYELSGTFDFACEKFEISLKYFILIKACVNDGIGHKAVLRSQLPVILLNQHAD